MDSSIGDESVCDSGGKSTLTIDSSAATLSVSQWERLYDDFVATNLKLHAGAAYIFNSKVQIRNRYHDKETRFKIVTMEMTALRLISIDPSATISSATAVEKKIRSIHLRCC